MDRAGVVRVTELAIDVRNVGGIEEASFTVDPPVSIVSGPNATNKTSLLRALAFGLGRDELSIRSGADEASVALAIGDRSVTRTATRAGTGIEFGGETWIDDPDDRSLFEYFGCLLEFNPLRSAVRQNDDIEPVLKEPVDVDALEARQSALMDEKRSLQREVESLADLEAEIREQEEIVETKGERAAELEAELADLQERQAATSGASERLDELREERADLVVTLEDVESRIEDASAAISRLEERRADLDERLEQRRAEAEDRDVGELKAERESLREEMDEITERVEVLQSVVTTNREILESGFAGVLGRETDLMDESVTCWVCGDAAAVDDIEQNVAALRELVDRDKRRRREFEPRLEEIESALDAARAARREVRDLESERSDLSRTLDDRRESLAAKRERAGSIREEIAALDDEIADLESEQTAEITDLTDEIESVRIDLQTARGEIERARERIETIEDQVDEREAKAERIGELSSEITDLTDRIENMEHHLRTEFNEAMADLVDHLDFDRVERVRLDGEFALVVAREVDGAVREDTVASLSESEREVIGLVLALAGYVTYDLDDITPVLGMDTLGALDADRVARLLEYVRGTPDFLVAAVLPENAGSLDFDTIRPSRAQVSESPN
jgi:chromosome segregation ATPase